MNEGNELVLEVRHVSGGYREGGFFMMGTLSFGMVRFSASSVRAGPVRPRSPV